MHQSQKVKKPPTEPKLYNAHPKATYHYSPGKGSHKKTKSNVQIQQPPQQPVVSDRF